MALVLLVGPCLLDMMLLVVGTAALGAHQLLMVSAHGRHHCFSCIIIASLFL
jgi:hypothetical protein